MRPTLPGIRLRAGVLALACGLHAGAVGALEPGSERIGCERADTLVTVTASAHLDPACTWTRGVEIVASGVVFDCQGARIVAAGDRPRGILITAPADVPLADVTVRNCYVEGFLNNVRVSREGFRDLEPGGEYTHAFRNIRVEDSTLVGSRGSGVFVDAYVTGVTLRNLRVERSGSVGIYLEAGSRDNVVEGNTIVGNGFRENAPSGQFFEFGGLTFWYWGTGREGLAVDGSRNNRIVGNRFEGNAAGAIFLYKNCGEYVTRRPERWWPRRYGAEGNVIEHNTIVGGRTGIWIGSRMGENLLPMDCSDPAYAPGFVLDHAAANVVRGNAFEDVTYAIRVEDDRNRIEENVFGGGDRAQQAIVIGTPQRTAVLGRPVSETVVRRNRSWIAGNRNPYRWVHGQDATVFEANEALGRPVGFCEGVAPARGPFVMAVGFAPTAPGVPVAGDPPILPPPTELPPCPLACASDREPIKVALTIGRLDTPPGDDTFEARGRLLLPLPLVPPLDPPAVGVGAVVEDAIGRRIVELLAPGGAYDARRRTGWRGSAASGGWKYVARRVGPTGGVTRAAIRELSRIQPGLVEVRIRARKGAHPVAPSNFPLAASLVVDAPTAETGQCARVRFTGAAGSCRAAAKAVRCS